MPRSEKSLLPFQIQMKLREMSERVLNFILRVPVVAAALLLSSAAQGQVQLDLSLNTPAAGSGTGWVAVNNTTAGKSFIDFQTLNPITGKGTNPAYLNLVGGTYSGSGDPLASASYAVNPLLQVQTAYIGGSTAADLGVAFRLRLGGYDKTQTVTGMVGAIWSVANQTNGTDAASFAIAATANSSGGVNGNYTTYSVSLMWNTDSSTINKASNFDTASQGFSNSVTLYNAVAFSSVTASSAKSSFVSIQTTSDGNIFNQGGTDTADAWLSFGVTFAAINNNVASIARNGNNFDATTAKWGFAPVAGSGNTPATFNGFDAVGTNGNIYMSDLIYANGSTVAGGIPTPIPEPSTYVMISALLAPAIALVMRRRRYSRGA